jgi:phosphonate transport system substrate-binding protein
MPAMFRRTLLAAAPLTAASMLAPAPARAADPTEINFGIIPETSQNIKALWAPFLDDFQKSVGVKVNGFYPSDYAGVIEAMRFDKVQIAWYGNASAIQAVDRAGGEVFAQKTYADGSKGYYSLLIVPKDSPFQTLADLLKAPPHKLNFGNGDPNSTSGFLVPSYYAWAKNGIDVRSFFKTIVSANHETNLFAVANHQVDVATNNTEDLAKFTATQPARAANIRAIWKSPIIPADPIVWRKDLPDALKARIRSFFLTYATERPGADVAHERKVLADLGGWGTFLPSSDAQLLPVRQVAAFRDKLTLEANATMDAAEKTKKISEIDARLKVLDAQLAKVGAGS